MEEEPILNNCCLTTAEASLVLGVSRSTVRNKAWRARHGLKTVIFGRSVRFRVSELERFMRVHESASS